MNKSFRPLAVLLALLTTSLAFSLQIPIHVAKATYVWGPIRMDTVWTLVDSPFVISDDITIPPNLTLTVEPSVEVRFGGSFSLIVEGTLIAEGSENRSIRFTSNRLNATQGDWGTILLSSTNSFASLIRCDIEYGQNGTTVEAGNLIVKDSRIASNFGNGITMINGTLEATNSRIEDNIGSGVYVEGNSKVTIQDNNVSSNGDGIMLAGNLTSKAQIQRNALFNNKHSGIALEALNPNAYGDTTNITENTVSSNNYGFYASTSASTNITQNYILNNTVGIFYEASNATGAGMTNDVHFNDIYDNKMGMDVSNVTVDAKYNFWGDKSGPEHPSLNPHGKGNPVGGDGKNLNFIFYLTRPFEKGNLPPTAVLQTDKTFVATNQNITFIGTNSYDDGQVDQYSFNFGDGINTGQITLSMFFYNYSSPGTYTLSLRVTDDFNATSGNTAATDITVKDNLKPLDVAVALSNETVGYNASVSVTAYVSTDAGPASNTNVRMLAAKGGTFTPASGSTNSTGYFNTVFTAPNVTAVSNIRIIASASMNGIGYADGSDYAYLKVLPPLYVGINATATTINSQDNTTVGLFVTDAFGEPVANVTLALSADKGTLSDALLNTDLNGTVSFTFEAPLTLTQNNVTITITASRAEYATQESQLVITVNPKLLTLKVTASSSSILSEDNSTITAHVTFNSAPIADATFTTSSNIGGSFLATESLTDSNGDASFVFIAPQITTSENAVATVTVTAHKSGYVDAEDQTNITITPKILTVTLTSQPTSLTSETTANVTAHVVRSYDMKPVPEANVTITSANGGNFSAATGLTDQEGNVTFQFTAPPTDAPTDVTISALAARTGYVPGQNWLPITVSPGTLTVQITTYTQAVISTQTTTVEVYVTSNSTAITNASVTLSSSYGNFSITSQTTDSTGRSTFLFNAPKTPIQLSASITARAAKNGYITAMNQSSITVLPEPTQNAGLSLTTILLIAIPLMIIAVLAVLIKLKVISISLKEEQD
jgi:parallel beta-helix repeat protein